VRGITIGITIGSTLGAFGTDAIVYHVSADFAGTFLIPRKTTTAWGVTPSKN